MEQERRSGQDRRRTGRPPLPECERASETLHLRVTRAEADVICRAAVRSNQSVSKLLRKLLSKAIAGLDG